VDCIICRTNKSVIAETINALKNDLNVHIHGGTQALTYLINSIHWLKVKGTTNHPDLFLFSNYKELLEYAKSDMGGDLLPIIKLIETYTHDRLISILESTKEDPSEADITITTAHKAKGLEWPTVKLANDFKVATPEYTPSDEETNILYVAASRALNTLDISGCPACWNPSFSQAIKNNQENYKLAKLTNIE
jgi:superfamily I DNA/RNA helicase